MSRTRMPLALAIGAPLLMLLAGGAAGWLTSPDDAAPQLAAGGSVTTVAGVPMPASLDAVAPTAELNPLPNTQVIDAAEIIGLDRSGALAVPAGGAIDLPLVDGAIATAVDPATGAPLTAASPLPAPPAPVPPVLSDQVPATPTPESTLTPPATTPRSTVAPATPAFQDPCVGGERTCAGAPGVVRAGTAGPVDQEGDGGLAPLQVSIPVAAVGDLAALCDTVQAGNVPDPFLTAANRPTVAVIVNQPSTLALTGTWADGSELAKVTMLTLPAHDAEWQRLWEAEHRQGRIVACITLPLDEVRAHAGAGVGELRASVLAISAGGRGEASGGVSLTIPLDGDDALFADRVVVADRGLQRLADGVLYPTVHVHYSLLSDAAVPAGSGLDRTTTRLLATHAFVEGADCSGWAVNRQGLDRTSTGDFRVQTAVRTVAGRDRLITEVDGDVHLDPNMPAGWQGHFCVWLQATADPTVETFTLALRGTQARSPRTPDYSVGVLLDDPELPVRSQLQIEWSRGDGTAVCTAAAISNGPVNGAPGSHDAACTTSARFVADGIVVDVHTVDAGGAVQPLLTVRVPVNPAACNPDDPFSSVSDGCDTGWVHRYQMPLSTTAGSSTVRFRVHVARVVTPGSFLLDPAHAWRLSEPTSFVF